MAKKELSYKAAVEEIESILQELESGEMDVDLLSGKVSRVTELIGLCREKLRGTEKAVNKILRKEGPAEEV